MKAYTFTIGDENHAVKTETERLKMVYIIGLAV